MDRLYFDGACPVCRKEMALLARWNRGRLQLIDIHELPAHPAGQLPDPDSLLRVLHLQTEEGHWLTGLEASARAWQHTAVGGLWQLLLWRPWRGLLERLYQRWAARRFHRLYGTCTDSSGCGNRSSKKL